MRSFASFHRTAPLFLLGLLSIAASCSLGCSPEERDFGGSASADSTSTGAGGGGTSASSSGAGGSPVQPGDLLRSADFPGTALLFDVAQGKAGGSLLAGRFSDTIDFGGGPLIDDGGADVFLARFGPADALIFSKDYGDAGIAGAIHADMSPEGTIHLTGDIPDGNTIDFGGNIMVGPGAYVAGVDPMKGLLYNALVPTGSAFPTPYSVAVDDAGEAVYAGMFKDMLVFGGFTLASAGDTDMYLVKVDAAGTLKWGQRLGGQGHDNGTGVAIDPTGVIAIVGYFNAVMPFGQLPPLLPLGGSDVFVARLGPAGEPLWARRIGGEGEEFIFGTVAVTSKGEIVVAGNAKDILYIESTKLMPAGSADVYIVKYAADGALLWANRYGDADYQDVFALAVDAEDNILVGGPFTGEINFGSGSVKSPAGNGAYLAKLDPSGNAIFTKVYSGAFESMFIEAGDPMSILVAGSGVGINLGENNTLVPSGGVFMARVAP